MLPIHKSKISVFNYDEIPKGYYYKVMLEGSAPQRFWHQKKFEEVADRVPEGSHVLDLGCGPGSFLSILGKRPGITGVGFDIAGSQIEFAKEAVESQFPDGRITFLEAGEESIKLPFDDNSFDVMTSIEVFEHIHPYICQQLLSDARRVLKPGGKVILTSPNYRSFWPLIEYALQILSPVKYHDQHINKYTPSSFVKFVESAGFEVTSIRTIHLVAPFLSGLSWEFAMGVHRFERYLPGRLGSLLVVECQESEIARSW